MYPWYITLPSVSSVAWKPGLFNALLQPSNLTPAQSPRPWEERGMTNEEAGETEAKSRALNSPGFQATLETLGSVMYHGYMQRGLGGVH